MSSLEQSSASNSKKLLLSTNQSEAIKCAICQLGLEALKLKQRDAVESYLSAKGTFFVLQTGYGKSVVHASNSSNNFEIIIVLSLI